VEIITKEQWEAASNALAINGNYEKTGSAEERQEFVNSIYTNFAGDDKLQIEAVATLVNIGKMLGRDVSDKIFGLGVHFGMTLQELRSKKENTIRTKPFKVNLDASNDLTLSGSGGTIKE
jgi:hypothetical protein